MHDYERRRGNRIAGIFFFGLLGLCLTLLGLYLLKRQYEFVSKANTTTGKVVTHVRVRAKDKDDSDTWKIVFTFKDQKGKTHRIKSSLSSNPPTHMIGDKVPVLYNPQWPSQAQVNAFRHLWLMEIIVTTIGLLILSAVVFCIPKRIKRHRELY